MAEESFLSDEFRQILNRFEQMLKENKSFYFDVEELEDLAFYYSDHFQFNKALQVIEHAKSLFPHHLGLLIREGEIYTGMGQLHKALIVLKKAESWEEEKLDWLMAISVVYSQLHEHDKAILYLEQAIDMADGDNYDDISLELALEYQNANKVDRAISLLKKVIMHRPDSETLLYELAYCYESTDRMAEGMTFFALLVDERPFSFPAWYCLGNLQQHLEQFEDSIESYEFSIAIMPDFAPALINKAQAQFKSKQYAAAIVTLESTFHLEPPDATTYCHLGECYEKLEEVEKAQELYKKAIQLDDRCADAYLGMAVVMDFKEQHVEALAFARIAFEFDPNNDEYALVYMRLLSKLNLYEDAIEIAESLVQQHATDEESWAGYADIHLRMHKFQEALKVIEAGLIWIPGSKMLSARKVVALYYNKQLLQAEDWLDATYEASDEVEYEELAVLFPLISQWTAYQNKKQFFDK
jgi:tetratricopeptide (TPR) repeat protein